jgi:hypothetical protein
MHHHEYYLEPIIDYNMSEEESLAYKIGLMWLEVSLNTFPTYKHSYHYPKKGDPRKSNLFKFCYKLQRETKGLIEQQEYYYYIVAQLQILKTLNLDTHPLITPQCLVGDKAWIRWKLWKNKFDKANKKELPLKEEYNLIEIKKELLKTKKFLDSKFGTLDEENFPILKKDITRYIALGMISGFYAVLSPLVQKHCNLEKIDLSCYTANEAVNNVFKEVFN